MNTPHDPLARLRAERAAEHAALVQTMAHQFRRYDLARAFGYRVALERLSWAEIKQQRALLSLARYAPEFAHASPDNPMTVGKDDLTMQVLSSYEWAAYLEGVDMISDLVDGQS